MGVSGCGKSTVAGILAGQLDWDLAEGDDLHPAANVAKMAAGVPLTDEDRWPRLDVIAEWIADHTDAGRPGVVTCSALKRAYRDKLAGPNVVFVHLAGTKDIVEQRLAARLNHFMPGSLLESQIATLEPPQADENAVTILAGRAPADNAAEIIRLLDLTPAGRTGAETPSPLTDPTTAERVPSGRSGRHVPHRMVRRPHRGFGVMSQSDARRRDDDDRRGQ
jgi:gluconokinase